MPKLAITCDNFDFIIYDLLLNKIIFKKEKSIELDCPHLNGQGKPTFYPHGITSDNQHIYLVANDKLAKYNLLYELESLINIPLFINTHEIIKDKDILYICNTSTNSIGIYDLTKNEHRFLDISTLQIVNSIKKPKDKDILDINHVNSLYDAGDKIWFCLKNKGRNTSSYGYIVKDTLHANMIFNAGISSHNIKIIDNILYTLSSGTGELIEINLATMKQSIYKVTKDLSYIRGLVHWDNKLIIGHSLNYKKQFNGTCYISILDLETRSIEIHEIDGITSIKDITLIN